MPLALSIAAVTVLAALAVAAGEAALSAHNAAVLIARARVRAADDVLSGDAVGLSARLRGHGRRGRADRPGAADGAGRRAGAVWRGQGLEGVGESHRSARGGPSACWSRPGAAGHAWPVRLDRHPNYLAVAGEIAGVALTVWAPITGAAALAGFGWLLWRQIAVEDRTLGRG